ncbi:MAG: alanine--glyoxylate aminotransferase family protein [Tissierellia bacterium]|nr:alanine--glyoxylate aminotransferase family protein [Tissierellia bacterium]
MKNRKLLMIPGPTPVVDSIRTEMGRDTIAFGDPDFVKDYKEVIDDLQSLFSCDGKTFVVAGTGTLAMETAIANSLQKGDKMLLVSNGFFGDRFIQIAERKGIKVELLQAEWGDAVTPVQIGKKLDEGGFKAVTVTHVDTSTGVIAPVKEIGEVVSKYDDVLYIVDGVCSVGGEAVDLKNCHINVLFTGSQKAFGVAPGLFMLWADEKALARRKSLGTIPEYYCDYENWIPIMDDPSKYFATPAVNLVWALKESVRIMKEEGMDARYARHIRTAKAMQKAFEAIGFTILAKEEVRAHTLSNLLYPAGIDDAAYRTELAKQGVQAAGGVGKYAGRMLRIGHMGNIDLHTCTATISAMERALRALGQDLQPGSGTGAFAKEWDAQ